jgi:hypothetical protein
LIHSFGSPLPETGTAFNGPSGSEKFLFFWRDRIRCWSFRKKRLQGSLGMDHSDDRYARRSIVRAPSSATRKGIREIRVSRQRQSG